MAFAPRFWRRRSFSKPDSSTGGGTTAACAEDNVALTMFVKRAHLKFLPIYMGRHINVTHEQLSVCRSHWKAIMSGCTQGYVQHEAHTPTGSPLVYFYDCYFSKLYNLAPELRDILHSNMVREGRLLMTMLSCMTGLGPHLGRVAQEAAQRQDGAALYSQACATAITQFETIAQRNAQAGLQPEHYSPMGDALLYALKAATGIEHWTARHRAAWSAALGVLFAAAIPKAVAIRTATGTKASWWKRGSRSFLAVDSAASAALERSNASHPGFLSRTTPVDMPWSTRHRHSASSDCLRPRVLQSPQRRPSMPEQHLRAATGIPARRPDQEDLHGTGRGDAWLSSRRPVTPQGKPAPAFVESPEAPTPVDVTHNVAELYLSARNLRLADADTPVTSYSGESRPGSPNTVVNSGAEHFRDLQPATVEQDRHSVAGDVCSASPLPPWAANRRRVHVPSRRTHVAPLTSVFPEEGGQAKLHQWMRRVVDGQQQTADGVTGFFDGVLPGKSGAQTPGAQWK